MRLREPARRRLVKQEEDPPALSIENPKRRRAQPAMPVSPMLLLSMSTSRRAKGSHQTIYEARCRHRESKRPIVNAWAAAANDGNDIGIVSKLHGRKAPIAYPCSGVGRRHGPGPGRYRMPNWRVLALPYAASALICIGRRASKNVFTCAALIKLMAAASREAACRQCPRRAIFWR